MPETGSATRTSRSRRGLTGLLGANFISILGTRMSMLAIPWFVLVTTGSAGLTGLVVFAEMAPYVLVQALGGPLVDRLGNRRTSIACDLAAGVSFGLIPLLHGAGGLPIPALAALVAIGGAARGAGDTARHVLAPAMAAAAGTTLERASGWYDGINRAASMIGAPLAGVLIAMTSAPLVVALDATTFVGSALLVALLVPAPNSEGEADAIQLSETGFDTPAERPAGYLASLREGFGHLAADRLLVAIAAMILVTNLLDQAFFAVLAPVWSSEITGSPVALGLLGAAMGVGSLIGNGTTAWIGHRLPRRLTFGWGFLVGGSPRFFVLAIAGSVSPALLVAFAAGLGVGGINPILATVEFERVPPRLQARVLGALGATAWAGIPFGALVGGALADGLGLQGALIAAGGLYLATTMAPFIFPIWREMDRRPSGPVPEPLSPPEEALEPAA